MKELNSLQKEMLQSWINYVERPNLKEADIRIAEDRLSALINSIEYEKPISYFPRIMK